MFRIGVDSKKSDQDEQKNVGLDNNIGASLNDLDMV